MKLPDKEPEAVLDSFKDWTNKGKRKGILKPTWHEQFPSSKTPTAVTPAFYTKRLYRVFFNELQRIEPSFQDHYDRCFAHLSEEHPEVMLKVAFLPGVHYNWNGIDKHIFRVFIETLTEKEMITEWEQPELMEYDLFHHSLWKLFNAELVRRGAITDLKQGKKFYQKHYD